MPLVSKWAKIGLIAADKRHAYVGELVHEYGLVFETYPITGLDQACNESNIIVLAGDLQLGSAPLIARFVAAGGGFISVGAVLGMQELLGVEPDGESADLSEGYLSPASEHPIVGSNLFPIHFFSGAPARCTGATPLAEVLDPHGRPTGRCGVALRRADNGLTIFIAPDIAQSAIRIRQGRYVDCDGAPAPDGSAPLNDGVLRSEDGMELDWWMDRMEDESGMPPAFLEPAVDRLAAILFRSVAFIADKLGLHLPVAWTYPRNSTAAGLVTFSTDGSDPHNMVAILQQANLVGLRGTWCVQSPGYGSDGYRTLRTRGHEVALLMDATDPAHWRLDILKMQQTSTARVVGVKQLTSVMVQDGRWRGRNEPFDWCAQAGLGMELGRGPSYPGNMGFPFGASRPFRPAKPDGSIIHTQSLPFMVHTPGIGANTARCLSLLDRVVAHHGMAHFTFHTKAFEEPDVSAAFRNLVMFGRSSGLEWMTADEWYKYDRARRSIQVGMSYDQRGLILLLVSEFDWRDATFLVSGPPIVGAKTADRRLPFAPVERFGFRFTAVVLDLKAKSPVELVLEMPTGAMKAA